MSADYKKYRDAKFQGPAAVREAQKVLLREHLLYARKHSQAYRKTLSELPFAIEEMGFEQLPLLPFTEKKDIEADPKSFLAVALSRVADIVFSSGTTGNPIQIYYTEGDLVRLAYNEEQSFAGCGIEPQDIALLTCTMDRCFIAGLAYFLGMRERGAAVIRNGHGMVESHISIIRTVRPTVIVGVPTFLRKLGLAMQKRGECPASSSVTKLICIGEPLRARSFDLLPLGAELEALWNAKVYSTYASSETITTFCECLSQRGGHLLPELGIVEIVDEQNRVLLPGEVGEVVMTPLAVEGMPLIRYKTGDISFVEETPCSCGRFSARLGPILGRKKHLMKVKGTSLYPQTVFSALDEIQDVSNYYIEVFSECELSDRLVIHVSLRSESLTQEWLENELREKLRVKPEILIENENTIRQKVLIPQMRKPVHFFDMRKQYAEISD